MRGREKTSVGLYTYFSGRETGGVAAWENRNSIPVDCRTMLAWDRAVSSCSDGDPRGAACYVGCVLDNPRQEEFSSVDYLYLQSCLGIRAARVAGITRKNKEKLK
jgi:hypothetical protein